MTASAIDPSLVLAVIDKGMRLYRSFIMEEPLTNIHTTTTTSTTTATTTTATTATTTTPLSSQEGRGNNIVLNNAALSLYTQLPSSILQRYPHLFDQVTPL